MVLLFSVVISIVRLTSLIYAKEKIILYKEMKSLVYILLFLPFGYLVTDMITEKAKKCPILIVGIITLITSFTTEVIQMKIGRSFDIDDILLNVIGGIIGVIGYKIFHKMLRQIPESWPVHWIKLFIFMGGIFLLFMGYTWLCEVI